MLADYPGGSTKISDCRGLSAGLHKLLMDIFDSINQLCIVSVAVPRGAPHQLSVPCSFMLSVSASV